MGKNQELKLNLKMLTPLRTGGINGTLDDIHATGIIGSLRWWYETIIRGLGGKACSPDNKPCTLDEKNYNELKGLPEKERLEKSGLCDACQLFGVTGWRRQFSLRVLSNPANYNDLSSQIKIMPENRSNGWVLPEGYLGSFLISLTGSGDALLKILALFLFLEKHGGIGAKQQLGYGLFKIESIYGFSGNTKNSFADIHQSSDSNISKLPDLRTFTFFEFGFYSKNDDWWKDISGFKELLNKYGKNQILDHLHVKNTLPISPIIKNHLRFYQKWPSGSLPQWFFGKSQGKDRIRSKIGISWAFKEGNEWKIRGWLYIPDDCDEKNYRNELLGNLKNKIGDQNSWLGMLNLKVEDCGNSSVNLLPLNSPWKIHNSNEILQFINESQGGEV